MTPRRELVEPNAPLSMRWQCELLGVNRSSLYYEPVEPDGEQLALGVTLILTPIIANCVSARHCREP